MPAINLFILQSDILHIFFFSYKQVRVFSMLFSPLFSFVFFSPPCSAIAICEFLPHFYSSGNQCIIMSLLWSTGHTSSDSGSSARQGRTGRFPDSLSLRVILQTNICMLNEVFSPNLITNMVICWLQM